MLSKKLKDQIIKASNSLSFETRDNAERLVTIGGVLTEKPFWLDKTEQIHEIEGKFYGDYIQAHPDFKLLVREGVLERLKVAQAKLPKDWQLIVRAGYRPYEVQAAMFDDYVDRLGEEYPEWSDGQCVDYAEQYISNPYRLNPCPHVTGGAVDVEVYDKKLGSVVDMGGKICELSVRSHCLNSSLNVAQRKNQETLIAAMCEAGFAPFSTEWWHFSYGDQRWASFYDKPFAKYGNTVQAKV